MPSYPHACPNSLGENTYDVFGLSELWGSKTENRISQLWHYWHDQPTIPLLMGGHPLHGTMFSRIPSLYLPDARSILPPVLVTKCVRILPNVLWGAKSHWVENHRPRVRCATFTQLALIYNMENDHK